MSIIIFFIGIRFRIIDYSIILEYNLFNLNSSIIRIVILLDWISLLFIRFVIFISSIVIFYRKEYILGDFNLNRFILLIIIFVVSIILLIIRPNLVSILLGWDGLGLVSYCLVIYYQNIKSYNAGILTALSNRIGDVALLISIAWLLNFGRWNYIFYIFNIKNDKFIVLIIWLVILAAITKRAQIPFSSWLPAAIAAPTPVSSLVHSSTLVTAGVYLLIRFNFAFNINIIYFLIYISSITIFISGLGANFEFDLKKIIALSTLSQLGLIIMILSIGSYKLSFFHLLTHALFKALLFICSGLIIHNFINIQDIRYLGGLINQLPYTVTLFLICNFSLCGFPFLSGFYSKDLIAEFMSINYINIYIYIILYISIGLTVCYRFRLSYYILRGGYNYIRLSSVKEEFSYILKGIRGLIFLVIIIGRTLIWLIFSIPYFICLSFYLKIITLFIVLIGLLIGQNIFKINLNYNFNKNYIFIEFIGSIWNIPFISTLGLNKYPNFIGIIYYKLFDQGWFEYYGRKQFNKILIYYIIYIQEFSKNNLKIFYFLLIFWLIFMIINLYLNSLYRA